MKPQLKKLALAVLIALGTANAPAALAVCPLDGAKPFVAGPVNPVNGFASYVQDSEGLTLELCLTGDGAGICFFDPPVAGNAFSQQIGFGAEGFWWSADALFASSRVDVTLVMAVEAAFLTEDPAPGDQFPFTRLRIRIDVLDPGVYTLVHPYGEQTWVIDTPGVRVVNESFDIQFVPNQTNKGRVGPWLTSVGAPFADPLGNPGVFIGDGAARQATGSPCGTNFARLTAKRLDGVTPLGIDPGDSDGDGRTDSVGTDLFAINGKLYTGTVNTPLAADAHYSRAGDGSGRVNVFATAPSTANLTATVGGNFATVTRDGDRYFASTAFAAGSPVPAVSVTADNDPPQPNNLDSTASPNVFDVVTITKAEATCSGTAPARTCSLVIEASSSDAGVPPALTVSGFGEMTGGALSVPGLAVVPATVNVTSTAGGSDTELVKVINLP